jgi:4-amino-4-deoxy-L-arabinose transferase-like glycosyltransferase
MTICEAREPSASGGAVYLAGMLGVLALMACNVFLGLATAGINDFEEGRYGVSAFEMQQHRQFVVPTYAGQPETWARKPPLGYWLMALCFSLFGGSAQAMRLPSALCALATVAITMIVARRWFGGRLALVAGLIVATTYGFLSHHGARSGDFDSCLTLILLLVAVALPGLGDSPWRLPAVALLLACGFLLKSFAVVPMLLVGAIYALWTGAWRRQRLIPCLAALGLFAAIVGSWAAARWLADGSPSFLVGMVREDVIDRSTSIVDRSTSSPFGYVTALFDRFAPWPVWMLVAGAMALRAGTLRRLLQEPVPRLLALWIAVPLLIISLVRTQHHWYLDPLYPALAMVAAASALHLVRRAPGRLRAAALVLLVLAPLALCEARVLRRALIVDPMPADQRFLSALPSAAGGCRELRSDFRLAYSERFILEVMDGFEVVEPSLRPARPAPPPRPAPPAASGSPPAAACLLVSKAAWRHPLAATAAPGDRPAGPAAPGAGKLLLADGKDFALYREVGP